MKNRVSELKLPLDETNGRLNNEKKITELEDINNEGEGEKNQWSVFWCFSFLI